MTRKFACLLGNPVAHSLSPALHNAAFAALGIDAVYTARLVQNQDVPAAVQALRSEECLGANVTAPHKAAVRALMDEVNEEVRLLGVTNTVVNRGGRLYGDNTDALGLARWMNEAEISVTGGEVIVLGAGGAARACLLAVYRQGARSIRLFNRTLARAEALIAEMGEPLRGSTLEALPLDVVATATDSHPILVINATSTGHEGTAPPVHPGWYSPETVAVDLAYNPPVTPFMSAAAWAGARTENGLGMLIHQAVLSFEKWTGVVPPTRIYEETALRELSQRTGGKE